MQNRQIILTSVPQGELKTSHFEMQTAPMPEPRDNTILVKTLYMSLDAANRAWMQGPSYRDAVKSGDVMATYMIGRVVNSRHPSVRDGSLVEIEGEWADYVVVPGDQAKIVPETTPLSNRLSILGIAGGQQKCSWLVNELGFDAAIDYKAGNLFKDLKAACPDGIDVYFDNVGGSILETVLFQMNLHGRIACCGAVSQHDTAQPAGPRNLPGLLVVKRLKMEGFIVMDFADYDEQAEADLAQWASSGQLKVIEDVVDGLENAPNALIGLLNGENRGKRMVRVADDG